MNVKLIAICFALILAFVDVTIFPIIKYVHQKSISAWWLIVPVILYGMQPLIFYKALDHSNVAVMNIMWDVMSDVLVTILAIYLLKEKVSKNSKIGIVFAMIAIYFFSRGEIDQ